MTDVSLQSLDPKIVTRIANLEMKAKQIVEGAISGRHRSPFQGQSIEFAQHREYAAGDDLRHLDWKLWAKTNRLYIKQYEEETNLRAHLLLDQSESMQYGDGDRNKYEYACQLSAALSYLLLRQSDAVGLIGFEEDIAVEVPQRSSRGHLRALLRAMHSHQPSRKTDLELILRRTAERFSKRGLVMLFSDLLADRASVLRGLKLLRQRQHEVLVFHILHDDELDFMFQGVTRFEGLESQGQVTCDPRALRADYLAAVERYLADLRRLCNQAAIDYRLIRTSEPADAVLAALLHERTRPR